MQKKQLTKKQVVFVEEFLRTWKPAEAARAAGYKHPDVQGSQTLKRPLIAEYIDRRMAEISMETNEVLTRLTQQARLNMGDFLIFEGDKIKLNQKIVKEYGYLIKGLSYSRSGAPILQLHDAQAALTLIGKARRMFVEQIEETHKLDQTNVNIYIPANGREPAPVEEEDGNAEF